MALNKTMFFDTIYKKSLLLKPIEKCNQDSVSILQGTLPYPTRPIEQGRMRFFCQQGKQGAKNYPVETCDSHH